MTKFLTVTLFAIAAFFVVSGLGHSDDAPGPKLSHEITPDGPALFFQTENSRREEVWAVHCTQPFRGCIARTAHLALRLDSSGNAWLNVATIPDSRISIQKKNTRFDTPSLTSTALSAERIASLSSPATFILVEHDDVLLTRAKTFGLNSVVDYLQWLESKTGRTIGDARRWPGPRFTALNNFPNDIRKRFHASMQKPSEATKQVIPSTKPQIEFAIRAQDGSSFFSGTGHAGY